jgi:hypothetical protein
MTRGIQFIIGLILMIFGIVTLKYLNKLKKEANNKPEKKEYYDDGSEKPSWRK